MPRWNSCNILQTAPDANRLWQFDAKGGGFVLNRESSSAPGQPLPPNSVAKSWISLWQPKLNVAWLPPENVFLRVIELPRSTFDETLAMVEFQLEKLSPIPVTQIVWTLHILPLAAENLQTVIVVIVERRVVEEFLGKLESQGYLADRLEVPMLDQLEAMPATEDGAWIYPSAPGGRGGTLVAWRFGGALRSLSFLILPPTGDRAASLKNQLAQFVWAGELEGWLMAQPKWHLVADAATAAEWESLLREGLGEPAQITEPLPPAELAGRTARRAATASEHANLLPAEFSAHYRQQFFDRLWLHGLAAALVLYLAVVVVYFCATGLVGYQTDKIEAQANAISGSYTNALQLKARYDVLKERQDLKFAALDSWRLVAEQLPDGVSLARLSFADGKKLSLNGTATQDQITPVSNFSDALRKAKLNGQPMFDPLGGDPFGWRQNGNTVTWSFGLLLAHTEEDSQ
ncbi:MAG TPA: hypothetical protein VK840_05150 [Candidatus Dormibacteraeota bacterium]|nr:hypothetical protein [Candidatus Dormibacteraeota bacterium]